MPGLLVAGLVPVFIIPFEVTREDVSIMPAVYDRAFVSVYVAAESYQDAVQYALRQLAADGLVAEDIRVPIHQMAPDGWSAHIQTQWPDQVEDLPDQAAFERSMRAGEIVYGPFGAYREP